MIPGELLVDHLEVGVRAGIDRPAARAFTARLADGMVGVEVLEMSGVGLGLRVFAKKCPTQRDCGRSPADSGRACKKIRMWFAVPGKRALEQAHGGVLSDNFKKFSHCCTVQFSIARCSRVWTSSMLPEASTTANFAGSWRAC